MDEDIYWVRRLENKFRTIENEIVLFSLYHKIIQNGTLEDRRIKREHLEASELLDLIPRGV